MTSGNTVNASAQEIAISADVKAGPKTRGLGFAGMSAFMSSDKEHSGFVFHRFKELAARDLLYMQSELLELEISLKRLDDEDVKGDNMQRSDAKNWTQLRSRCKKTSAGQFESPTAARRKGLILEIREKLKEYRRCSPLSLKRLPDLI